MVSRDYLLKKLKEKKTYELDEFIEHGKLNLYEVRKCLLNILQTELQNIPCCDDVNNYKYIYKIFKYLEKPSTHEEKKNIMSVLYKCRNICNRKINSKRGRKHSKVFEKINDIICAALADINEYDVSLADEQSTYQVLYNLIFELRNYDYVYELIKTFPYRTLARNAEGKYLVEELIDRYLFDIIKNKDSLISEIIYLQKIIKLFFDNPKFLLPNNEIRKILRKLEDYTKEIDSLNIEESKKGSALFFISDLISVIDKNEYTKEELLSELKKISDGIDIEYINSKDLEYLFKYIKDITVVLKNEDCSKNSFEKVSEYTNIFNEIIECEKLKRRLNNFNNKVIKFLKDVSFKKKAIDYLDYKYSINKTFNSSIREEEKRIFMDDKDTVIDLRDKFTLTIDNENTKIYDDALSIEMLEDGSYLLGIYLTDVASFIPIGSKIDERAYETGKNIYSINKTITIFSDEFIDKFSLIKDEQRRVIGFFFKFNNRFELLSFDIKKCLIKIGENYSHYKANTLITDSRETDEIVTLKKLVELSRTLMKRNEKEYEVSKEIKNLRRTIFDGVEVKGSISSIAIEDIMIYLNWKLASIFANNPNLPFIYRNNLGCYDEKVMEDIRRFIQNNNDYKYLTELFENVCPPSFYSINNLGHNGFQLDAYCHATNPLRNYASVETQRLIVKYLIDKDKSVSPLDYQRTNQICEYLNSRIQVNDEYMYELSSLLNRQLTKK